MNGYDMRVNAGTPLSTSSDAPNDVCSHRRREVRLTPALESTRRELTRNAVRLQQVVAGTEGNEVRQRGRSALRVGVVVIAVRRCRRAATTEDVEVFASIACACETFRSLCHREVSLRVFLDRGAARTASDDDQRDKHSEGDDEVTQEQAVPPLDEM